jgi:two-component system chemotaxis response regulator CheB
MMELEVKMAGLDPDVVQSDERPGRPSAFSCPECKGVLWELQDGDLVRFRCRTGHAFSAESVLAEQSEALETALYVALNTLEESANLSRRMLGRARERNQTLLAERLEKKVREAESRAEVIRQVLMKDETTAEAGVSGSAGIVGAA